MPENKDINGIAYAPTSGLVDDPAVAVMLGCPVKRLGSNTKPRPLDICIGWGQKKNSQNARQFAKDEGLSFHTLEDGFIGYVGHPAYGGARVSMSVDDETLFYDARHPSRLEHLINSRIESETSTNDQAEADTVCRRIKTIGASKYNLVPRRSERPVPSPTILVVDQTLGDRSISFGLAGEGAFAAALHAALKDYPEHQVLVRTHPDVVAGIKESAIGTALDALSKADKERTSVSAEAENPYDLFERVEAVYCVTSQLGFEALIAGKKVVTFGWPFYAGWGLTDDRAEKSLNLAKRRSKIASLSDVVLATLVDYTRYCDPFTMKRCDLHRILDILEAELAIARPLAGKPLRKIGFSLWKYSFIGAFLPHAGLRNAKRTTVQSDMLVWGKKPVPKSSQPSKIWRMEDGFVRSVGLGSDLKRPASLVVDGQGIYYDASGPSDLETWLSSSVLSKEAADRAATLRKALLSSRVTKYNVGERRVLGFKEAAGARPVILVPGQVESDASIQFGSPEIKTNKGLLLAVREANPDAFIVYKPHPDVLSGNRSGDKMDPAGVADWLVTDADILDCFDAVDEVHTLTSLSGFEALLRGLPVTCYGLPFYAGWGLTKDRLTCGRRGRSLSLEHLIYGALVAYPRYFSWQNKRAVGPEEILAEVGAVRAQGKPVSPPSWLKRQLMKFYFLFEALLRY